MDIRAPRTKSNTTRKAAIYLRQSLDQTGEQLAIERQREDCERLAMSKGWDIVGEYVDNSISASKASVVRPGYEAMVADLHDGKFDSVICYNIDRLTRQPRQVLDWIDWAQEKDIYLATVSGDFDLSTEMGRTMAGVFSHFARLEVDRKGARQARALRQRAELGGVPKGVPLTGYDKDGNVIESEAETVRHIFDLFAAGETLKGIARAMNDAGVKTRRGGKWDASTILTMLRNARYCGRSTYREQVRTPEGKRVYIRQVAEVRGNWTPLVSEEQFDLIQSRLNDPARRTNRVGTERKHIGTGLYRCEICGGKLRSNSGRYWCPQGGHMSRVIELVDEFVLRLIAARLSQPDALEAFREDTNKLMAENTRQAKALEARLESIERDYDSGEIDGKRYRAASEGVKEQLEVVYSQRATIVGGNALAEVLRSDAPAQAFLDASLGVKRAIIDALVTVTLLKGVRGQKGFDPDSVRIEWKG